jgi:hypothetical protein
MRSIKMGLAFHGRRGAGGRTAVGLQARSTPTVRYVRDLLARGYVGTVLSTTLVGSGGGWTDPVARRSACLLDRANGATMLAIPFGHTVDAWRSSSVDCGTWPPHRAPLVAGFCATNAAAPGSGHGLLSRKRLSFRKCPDIAGKKRRAGRGLVGWPRPARRMWSGEGQPIFTISPLSHSPVVPAGHQIVLFAT